jgi:hypothetical protein
MLPPAPTDNSAGWTYPNLEGVPTLVEDDDDTSFTAGRPDPVGAIDRASQHQGCNGVLSEYQFWRGQLTPQRHSDEYRSNASVYARYAADRARSMGCGLAGS